MAVDANQRWDVGQAIAWMAAEVRPVLDRGADEPRRHPRPRHDRPCRGADPGGHRRARPQPGDVQAAVPGRRDRRLPDRRGRLAGVNEVIAVLLMAAEFGVPVCPHAGGVGCASSSSTCRRSTTSRSAAPRRPDDRVRRPPARALPRSVVIRDARWRPTRPGYSAEMRPESLARYRFPDGDEWRAIEAEVAGGVAAEQPAQRGEESDASGSASTSARPIGLRAPPRGSVAGRPRADPPLEHPQLHDLPRRDRPVRLLRIHGRRLRGRHGGDGRRSRDATLVGPDGRDAGTAPDRDLGPGGRPSTRSSTPTEPSGSLRAATCWLAANEVRLKTDFRPSVGMDRWLGASISENRLPRRVSGPSDPRAEYIGSEPLA